MSRERILIVDDEQITRTTLRELLAEEGYETLEAADGEEALAKIRELSPDVVLSDMRMPNMNGMALLKQAKDDHSSASFVMMTASARIQSAFEALRAGAENFLAKPIDISVVLEVLDEIMRKRRSCAARA